MRSMRRPGRPRGPGPDAAGVDGEGRPQRASQGPGQRQVRQAVPGRVEREASREGGPDRSPPSSAWTSLRSPARNGTCGWRSPAAPRAGTVVATLRGAVVRRGTFVLGPVNLQVNWTDRVAIVGANGSGKSTLLAALLGRIPLDEGDRSLGPAWWWARWTRPEARFHGPEPLVDAFSAAAPSSAGGRRPHGAGQVRPSRGTRATAGRDIVAGRADPGGAGAVAGAWGQPVGP